MPLIRIIRVSPNQKVLPGQSEVLPKQPSSQVIKKDPQSSKTDLKSEETKDRPVTTIIKNGYNLSWEKSHRELSGKLVLPDRPEESPKEVLGGHPENILTNSWFSVEKTGKSKSGYSWTCSLDLSKGNSGETLRTRKYQIRLSKLAKQKIKNAMIATKYLYNKCVQLSENPDVKINLGNLRRLLITECKENILPNQVREEFKKTPYDVRDGAIRDFVKAYNTQISLVSQDKKKHFRMSYMPGKYRSIVLNHKHFHISKTGELGIFPRIWGITISCKEQIPKIEHDTRLVLRNDRYLLYVPMSQKELVKSRTNNVVALDPGVRTFQTTYDTNGISYSIGCSPDISRLDKLSRIATRLREGIKRFGRKRKDKIFSKVKPTKGMIRKAGKIEETIKNKMSDLHRKTCKFLCSRYDVVVLPKFESQKMSKKTDESGNYKRKIGKDTSRKMIRWGHFNFRSLLIAKGIQTGTEVVIGTEEWTSKTCTNCLKINYDLGGNKSFECPNCSLVIDRDINGTRNILLKNWESTGLPYKPRRVVTARKYGPPSGPVS